MKKLFKISTSILMALIAGSVTTTSFAAVAGTKSTQGTVTLDSGGGLSLKQVPGFDFGTVKVGQDTSGKDGVSKAVVVEDLRATGAGWKLTLRYGDSSGNTVDPTKAWTNTDSTIYGKGFEMKLPAIKLDASDVASGTNVGNAPTASAVNVNGAEAPVLTATGDTTGENAQGLGYWAGTYVRTTVTLDVPSNNIKGDYASYLVWTLNDVPA